jgi:Flp pilus assembly protein TadB
MLTGVLLAAAVVVGVPLPLVAVGWLASVNPVAALVAVVGLVAVDRVRRGRPTAAGEGELLRVLGSELASGASLRLAIAAVASGRSDVELRAAGRLALAGAPMEQVSWRLVDALPASGRMLAAAISLGSRTGAGLGALVQRLAERADDRAEMERERRAATVQARLSTLVVGLAPLLFTGLLVLTGAVPAPWRSTGALAFISAIGLALEVAGLLVVVVMLRRHAP